MFKFSTDNTKNSFLKYLENLGISPKTHKNYKSDLAHFNGWLILKVRSFGSYIETLSEAVPFLNTRLSYEYKSFLIENKIPPKTINRRLSTLRHLSRFLLFIQALDRDFMKGIENINEAGNIKFEASSLVEDFRAHLEAEKISQNTIKNYLSDVRQFLNWLESNDPSTNQTTN
jgi:site-specific recombinase XerD